MTDSGTRSPEGASFVVITQLDFMGEPCALGGTLYPTEGDAKRAALRSMALDRIGSSADHPLEVAFLDAFRAGDEALAWTLMTEGFPDEDEEDHGRQSVEDLRRAFYHVLAVRAA